MRLLYGTLTLIIYPLLIILIFFRKIINKEDKNRYKEKIFPSNFNVKRSKNSKLILFHAASIGELKSILPIINDSGDQPYHVGLQKDVQSRLIRWSEWRARKELMKKISLTIVSCMWYGKKCHGWCKFSKKSFIKSSDLKMQYIQSKRGRIEVHWKFFATNN